MRTAINERELKKWIFFYNFKRRYKILNGLTPIEKYLNLIPPKHLLDEWKEFERKRRLEYQLNYYREHREERIAYQLKRYYRMKKRNRIS